MTRDVQPHSDFRVTDEQPRFTFPTRLRRELIRSGLIPDKMIAALEWEVSFYLVQVEADQQRLRPSEMRASFEQGIRRADELLRWLRDIDPDVKGILWLASFDHCDTNFDPREVYWPVAQFRKALGAALADHIEHESKGGRPQRSAPAIMLCRISRLLNLIGHDIDKRPNGPLVLVLSIIFEALKRPHYDVLNIVRANWPDICEALAEPVDETMFWPFGQTQNNAKR